jgi:hypothetical protein
MSEATTPKKKKSIVKRIFKWTGITFLFLLIVLISLPFIFKGKIAELIKKEVNKNVNATVDWESFDLTLISTWPDFTFQLNGLTVDGKDDFEGVRLMGMEKLDLVIDLKSAIFGDKYEVKKIGLYNPEINVLVYEDGRANYDIAISDTTATEEEVAEESAFSLSLSEYYIKNGNVVYDDRSLLTYTRLKNLNHSGKGDLTQDVVLFSTLTSADQATISYDGIKYLNQSIIDMKFDIEMNMVEWLFKFQENNLRINAANLSFDGWFKMAEDFYDMDITFKTNENTFKSILSLVPGAYTPDFGDLKTDGTFSLSGFVKGKMDDVNMPGFGVDLSVDKAWFQYPDLPNKVQNITVRASVNSPEGPDMDKMVVDVSKFHMEWLKNLIDANLKLTNPMSDPNIACGIRSLVDLAKLSETFPLGEGESYNGILSSDISLNGRMSALENEDYEKFKAEGTLALSKMLYQTKDLPYDVKIDSMLFRFSPKFLDLVTFTGFIGESDMQAKGKIDNYMAYFLRGELLHGVFDFTSNRMNLDQMMGSTETQATPATASAPAETAPTETSGVIEVPKNIDFVLNSAIKTLVYDSLPISDIKGTIEAKEGVARLRNVNMNMFGGSMGLNGTYDTRSSTPKVNFDYDMRELDIKQSAAYFNTIEKMAPMLQKCTGRFSSKFNMTTDLDKNMEPVYETMNGGGNLKTKSVYIEGLEPLNQLAANLKIDRLAKQTINDVSVDFKFINGKMVVEPFKFKMGKIDSEVAGSTAFTQEIDYVMAMQVPRSEMGAQANAVIGNLTQQAASKGVNVTVADVVPVKAKITGTTTDPKMSIDLAEQGKNMLDDVKEQIKEQIKEKVEEKIEEIKEDVKAKVEEEVAKIMDEANKRASQIRAEGKTAAAKTKDEGYKQAQAIEDAAKNPLEKAAAKKAADKVRAETDEKARKIEDEANKRADQVIKEAEAKADKVRNAGN